MQARVEFLVTLCGNDSQLAKYFINPPDDTRRDLEHLFQNPHWRSGCRNFFPEIPILKKSWTSKKFSANQKKNLGVQKNFGCPDFFLEISQWNF
uniref:Uncharacterized protein n=1 Tax=viral metagenome TaxID=1070528 RepID=A0A6C0BMQ1_9ZZZZ